MGQTFFVNVDARPTFHADVFDVAPPETPSGEGNGVGSTRMKAENKPWRSRRHNTEEEGSSPASTFGTLGL